MFPVFHLAWSTCRATKTLFAGWRKLLRKVERGSTLSNKLWLCCSFFIKLTTCRATNLLVPYKSTNQRAAFLQPATNVFVAGQVDQARWKTRDIDQNLQRNNVARQVEGFCVSYFAALRGEKLNYNSCTSLLLRKSQKLLFLAPEVQWALKVTVFVRFTFSLNVSNHAHIWYVTWPQ